MASARVAASRAAQADTEAANTFRRRILDAMAAEIADRGYPNTTVGDVVRRAQTSRRTFYAFFPDREACYVALLVEHNTAMIDAIIAGVEAEEPWHTQIEQAIDSWIAVGEANPALQLSWIRDAPSLGARAHLLQLQFTEAFVTMLLRLCNTKKLHAAGIGPISRARAVMVLGGLRELTAVTLEKGGRISQIRREAVDASVALLGPQTLRPASRRARA